MDFARGARVRAVLQRSSPHPQLHAHHTRPPRETRRKILIPAVLHVPIRHVSPLAPSSPPIPPPDSKGDLARGQSEVGPCGEDAVFRAVAPPPTVAPGRAPHAHESGQLLAVAVQGGARDAPGCVACAGERGGVPHPVRPSLLMEARFVTVTHGPHVVSIADMYRSFNWSDGRL